MQDRPNDITHINNIVTMLNEYVANKKKYLAWSTPREYLNLKYAIVFVYVLCVNYVNEGEGILNFSPLLTTISNATPLNLFPHDDHHFNLSLFNDLLVAIKEIADHIPKDLYAYYENALQNAINDHVKTIHDSLNNNGEPPQKKIKLGASQQQQASSSDDYFAKTPNEMLLHIFSFLNSPYHKLSLRSTCLRFKNLVDQNLRDVLLRDRNLAIDNEISFKDLYLLNFKHTYLAFKVRSNNNHPYHLQYDPIAFINHLAVFWVNQIQFENQEGNIGAWFRNFSPHDSFEIQLMEDKHFYITNDLADAHHWMENSLDQTTGLPGYILQIDLSVHKIASILKTRLVLDFFYRLILKNRLDYPINKMSEIFQHVKMVHPAKRFQDATPINVDFKMNIENRGQTFMFSKATDTQHDRLKLTP